MSNGTDLATRPETGMGGFDGAGNAVVRHEGATAGVVAREESEIKASILMARTLPRDEAAAYTKLMRSANILERAPELILI